MTVWTGQGSCGARLPSTRARLGGVASCAERFRHGPEGGLQDVVAVDARNIGDADADLRAGHDWIEERAALRGAELLGIVEAFGEACRIEDHGSGDDRAGPGTAAGFVDAADRRQTPRHRVLLESEMGA